MQNLILGVTNNCNFSCTYCEQKHTKSYMSFETAKKAVDSFNKRISSDTSKVQISFYGGEPLLARELIQKVVNYANETVNAQKITYQITTNGSLIDNEFCEFCKENGILIALSHDGISQKYTRGHIDEVNNALDRLIEYFPATQILITLLPEFAHTLADSVKFFHSRGVKMVNVTPACGDNIIWDDNSFNILKEQIEEIAELYVDWNQNGKRFIFVPLESKIRLYINGAPSAHEPCKFCAQKVLVDVEGRFYPCTHFIGNEDFIIGDIYNDFNIDKINTLEISRVTASECDLCGYNARCKHRCACANYGYNKSLSEPSAFQCEYEKLLIKLADKAASVLISEENPVYLANIYR